MSALYTEIVRGSFTLAAVATGSLIALYTYFRQKEYELVKQRYLEQSVDAITTQLETSLNTVSHNYARCLQIVKSFRDSGEHFDIKKIDRGFLDIDTSKFLQIANHRVSSLLGSNIIWDVYQSAMDYAVTANSTIQREIPDAIRIHQTTDLQQIKQRELVQTIAKDLQKLHENGFKYSVLVAELHYLSLILELEKLSLKAIKDFNDRPEARQVIAHLTAAFPRDLFANDPTIAA